MFSQSCVKNSVHREGCMTRGYVLGACMAEGSCMAEGVHGEGMHGQCEAFSVDVHVMPLGELYWYC